MQYFISRQQTKRSVISPVTQNILEHVNSLRHSGNHAFLINYEEKHTSYIIHKNLQTPFVYRQSGVCMFVSNIHKHTLLSTLVSLVSKSETNSFSHRN